MSPKEQLSKPWLSWLGVRLLPSSFSCRAPTSEFLEEAWAGVAHSEPWSGGRGP